jgi:hypothetical protein
MKKQIIFSAILAVLTLGVVIFSFFQTRRLENEYIRPALPKNTVTAARENKPVLAPGRPQDYGMVVTDEAMPVLTQEYWDSMVGAKVKELKSGLQPQEAEKIDAKIKEDPVKTREKIRLIDENIAKCRKILAKDPADRQANEKLRRLLILRSVAKGLP